MLTMWDSTDLSQFPAGPFAVAGYVNGMFTTAPELARRFPHAHILTIAVTAAADAGCLDIETGDATPADAAGWHARQKRRGAARPCLYANASTMQAGVVPALRASGIARSSVRLWSAHYTKVAHICGPRSCGAVSIDMDGTQWTDKAMGRNLDQSLLLPDFFGAIAVPVPVAAPPASPPAWQEAIMNVLPVLREGDSDKTGRVFYVHRMQALVKVYGEINDLAAAACQVTTGTFDAATRTAVEAVQAHKHLTADGICGPQTWSVLIDGSAR